MPEIRTRYLSGCVLVPDAANVILLVQIADDARRMVTHLTMEGGWWQRPVRIMTGLLFLLLGIRLGAVSSFHGIVVSSFLQGASWWKCILGGED